MLRKIIFLCVLMIEVKIAHSMDEYEDGRRKADHVPLLELPAYEDGNQSAKEGAVNAEGVKLKDVGTKVRIKDVNVVLCCSIS